LTSTLNFIKYNFLFSIVLFFSFSWPSYIALKIGFLPGLTPDRIFIFILIIIISIHILQKTSIFYNLEIHKKITIFLFIWLAWNLISSIAGSNNVPSSIAASINWYLSGPIFFLLVLVFIQKEIQTLQLIKLIVIIMFIINIIGIVELYKGDLLFNNFLITKNEFTLDSINQAIRNGIFRIRSVFSNPLVYSQFLLTYLPLLFFIYKKEKKFIAKLFYLTNIFIAYFVIYKTGSRAGLALAILFPFIFKYISFYRIKMFKFVSNILIIFSVILFTYFIYEFYINNLASINSLHSLNLNGKISEQELSTLARFLQFELGLKSIIANPLFGIGFGQAVEAVKPLTSIDNYYLTQIISGGVIGLLFFIIFLYLISKIAIRNIKNYKDSLTIYLYASFILINAYYIILSIAKADILLFIVASLIYLRSNQLKVNIHEK
jgi:O-antigen ligase